jgi:hypothetical protein
MKIKEENLDLQISCPLTSKIVWVRELESDVYIHYYNRGYQWLFETEEVVEELATRHRFTKEKINKDDIS